MFLMWSHRHKPRSLYALLLQLEKELMATQAELDAATAAMTAMHTQVQATLAEIAALKASASLDSTALVAATATLTADTSSLASA